MDSFATSDPRRSIRLTFGSTITHATRLGHLRYRRKKTKSKNELAYFKTLAARRCFCAEGAVLAIVPLVPIQDAKVIPAL